MPIYKDGNGVIQYTPIDMDKRWEDTGVIPYGSFALCHPSNVVKQIQFLVNPTTSAPGTLTLQADIAGDQTINLTSLVGTSNSFTTMQPDAGTSPVATSPTDTLTFTSSDSALTITGDSGTDTLDFTVGPGITNLLPSSSIFMFSTVNSDIGGYESAPALNMYTSNTNPLLACALTTTPSIMEEFATASGYPGVTVIPIGLVSFHYETTKVAGSNNYYTYVELYKRTSGGTETLLATSDNSSQTALNTTQQITVTAYLSSITTLNTTDRLIAKIYGVMVSSTATVNLGYDGTTNARMQIPALSTGLNTGDVTLTTIGSSPNANGASLSGQILNLQPASASFGGVVTTAAQTFAGNKTFTGTILGANGTASLPEFSFSGATSTGIYNPSGNQVAISTTGAQRFNIDGNGYLNVGGNYTDGNAQVQFTSGQFPTVSPTFALKTATSQTTDHFIVVNTSNTKQLGITSDYRSYWGMSSALSGVSNSFTSVSTTSTTMVLKARTSQTSDFFQVQNTSGTPLVGIAVGGNSYFGSNGVGIANTSHYFKSISKENNTVVIHKIDLQTAPLLRFYNQADVEIGHVNIDGLNRYVDGSTAGPTYSFINDTDTGIYRITDNNIGIATNGAFKLGIDQNGNIRCKVHDNATTFGNVNDQEIRSQTTFSPTFSNLSNISNITSNDDFRWYRIGNLVTIVGTGEMTSLTGGVDASFEMSLPVTSGLDNYWEASGNCIVYAGGKNNHAFIAYAEITNDTIKFESFTADGGDPRFTIMVTYEVL